MIWSSCVAKIVSSIPYVIIDRWSGTQEGFLLYFVVSTLCYYYFTIKTLLGSSLDNEAQGTANRSKLP